MAVNTQMNGVSDTNGNSYRKENYNSSLNGAFRDLSKLGTKSEKPMKADREGVDNAFSAFAQLIHASRRPLPTQNGDGTYSEEKKRPGLRKDIMNLKMRGKHIFVQWKRALLLLTWLTQISKLSWISSEARSEAIQSRTTRP